MTGNLPNDPPDLTFAREAVDDLGVYLALRAAGADTPIAARAAAAEALDRIARPVR